MKLKRRNLYLEFIIGIIAIYVSVLILLFIFQRSLMYHPLENNYSGDRMEVEVEKVKIITSDNINLLGWFHKLNHFTDMDVNFLIIAWRGFSGYNGKPSEEGLYIDANSTILWLKKLGLTEKDIVIYGESLGTGVATEMAQNKDYAGLILETPFTSMVEAAKNFYPYIPVSILLKDKYDNQNKIKNINIPVLIMHGEVDQIVPFWMGKKIYEIANQPKYSHFTKFDDHMMEYDENLLFALKAFIKSLN